MSENKNVKLKYFGIPKLLPFVKPYKKIMISMIIMGALSSLIDSIYPLFNQYALNHFIALKTTDTIVPFIIVYIVILIVFVILNFVSTTWAGKIEMSVNRDLRNASFNHLQELSFSYFNQNNVGYVHARVMSDTGRIGQLVSWDMMDMVWQGSYLLFVLINMALINIHLAMYIMLIIPFAVILIIFFQKKLVALNRRIREINSKITSNFNEGIAGAKSIKTLVVENKINHDFDVDSDDMEKTSVLAGRYSALFSSLVTMLSSITLAIILWKGGMINQEGIIMIGTLSVFMTYALNMLEPIQSIVGGIARLIAIQVNIERFTTLLETQSDVADRVEVVEKYGDTFHPKKENWETLYGDVEFKDVSFKYPDGNEMVLEHFDLKVPHGTNVAIVGETGAGKSTLVNLVCRFFEPTYGQVLIDGKDARDRSQLWLHSNIGYVLQTPHLFSGTVRDNLRYGKPDATDEEIWKALKLVNAEFVIDKMDKGLDSEVGEGGDMLSTGEKQLISFARAILADPKILVLDEATASIDTLTEKAIQDAIFTVIKGRTSFVIAHRLSTIVDADVILVVKDGKIIERGKHAELMQAHGYYYDLYTRQYEEMVTNTVSEIA
ncbi:ABC transporter ATP-binding protein [Bulleidia sp. HCP3S3_F2]|uniref:ABC transporter ATP-binding protein n=1 Tax=unclassified Bulleidia TaxID=2704656 RepID=UPI002A906564|nr:ABC transporter ATP-binding protein/permease [Erysipelotrichaceae bacterium]MDD7057865.1 ABC transporter ATP-binding protein [Erysipelotrichaceae bacterium]MDY3660317.1 ABC transporter ATP-binding protein [Bulleidia sp.]